MSSTSPSPEVLCYIGGRAFGLLSDLQAYEDCQIATIEQRHIILPTYLDLKPYLGSRIGMVRVEEEYLVRKLA